MVRKRFTLVLVFLNLMYFNLKCDANSQNFLNEVTALKNKGLTLVQIYDQLKLKDESFLNFNARLQKAMSPISQPEPIVTYPYQNPQNYNSKYVIDDYYFLGDITMYGNDTDVWRLKDPNGRLLATINANKVVQLSPVKSGDQNDNIYNDMQKFKITDQKSVGYILNSNNKSLGEVRVFIQKNGNIITMYIGNPSVRSTAIVQDVSGKAHRETTITAGKGFKVVFDSNKFKDYLTQTYFYKLLLNSPNYQVIGFGLGFTIDPTKVALINASDISQVLDVFNIKLIFKITDLITGVTKPIYDSEPLANQDKINEQNYEEQIKYADLFALGILSVEPLGDDDLKKINSIR